MRRFAIVLSLLVLTTFGLVLADRTPAEAQDNTPTVAQTLATPALDTDTAKSCGSDSDCPYGKCSGGKCGACGFDSDCKGYGKCSGGHCGACGFDSDCKGFGKCSSGHCEKSPY